ncbi:unnamed protein product [Linum trigynum]|uniref:Uncharacterized protein n=1 Tax=Linum trigynum TaxID=586398 RepID=A0AAV2FMP9_9ROSI
MDGAARLLASYLRHKSRAQQGSPRQKTLTEGFHRSLFPSSCSAPLQPTTIKDASKEMNPSPLIPKPRVFSSSSSSSFHSSSAMKFGSSPWHRYSSHDDPESQSLRSLRISSVKVDPAAPINTLDMAHMLLSSIASTYPNQHKGNKPNKYDISKDEN